MLGLASESSAGSGARPTRIATSGGTLSIAGSLRLFRLPGVYVLLSGPGGSAPTYREEVENAYPMHVICRTFDVLLLAHQSEGLSASQAQASSRRSQCGISIGLVPANQCGL